MIRKTFNKIIFLFVLSFCPTLVVVRLHTSGCYEFMFHFIYFRHVAATIHIEMSIWDETNGKRGYCKRKERKIVKIAFNVWRSFSSSSIGSDDILWSFHLYKFIKTNFAWWKNVYGLFLADRIRNLVVNVIFCKQFRYNFPTDFHVRLIWWSFCINKHFEGLDCLRP